MGRIWPEVGGRTVLRRRSRSLVGTRRSRRGHSAEIGSGTGRGLMTCGWKTVRQKSERVYSGTVALAVLSCSPGRPVGAWARE